MISFEVAAAEPNPAEPGTPRSPQLPELDDIKEKSNQQPEYCKTLEKKWCNSGIKQTSEDRDVQVEEKIHKEKFRVSNCDAPMSNTRPT